MTDRDDIVITIEIKDRSKEREDEDGGKSGSGGKSGNGGKSGPTATPLLLIPYEPGDAGRRPLAAGETQDALGIQAMITNSADPQGWTDFEIQLSCILVNLGAVASVAGFAEFYVSDQTGIWNASHQGVTAAQVKASAQLVGRASFTAPPGKAETVLCPNLWKPGSSTAAQKGVLVQVSDLFTDPMTAPFDAFSDRHVARNDGILDPIIHSVMVSGSLHPSMKTDVVAMSVGFFNAATLQKFSAEVIAGKYTIFLPNPAPYYVSVVHEIVGGVANFGSAMSDVGNLNLNVSGATYTFDIAW